MKQALHSFEAVDAAELNRRLAPMSAIERVRWVLKHLPGPAALSSSFGAQAAVSLHMLSRVQAGIPVILVDTGYLFPETYRFIDTLVARLSLNLRVYRPVLSPAWMEARHGQLWREGSKGIARYNAMAKVEPMARALAELDVRIWFAGLRRAQADTRRDTPLLQHSGARWKVHPLADWSDQDVYRYLKHHDLPYHPLWAKGYLSIGDTHTTRPFRAGMRIEDTRFFGIQRECGIHGLT